MFNPYFPIAKLTKLGTLLLIVSLSTGCSLVPGLGKKKISDAVSVPTGNQYTVMIKGSKPETREIVQGLTVSGVLKETGAAKKYSRMEIVLKRPIPGKRNRHRLDVDYDPKKRAVPFEQDYAIHPNDIVIIQPDNSTQLDRMVDSLSDVFGKKR